MPIMQKSVLCSPAAAGTACCWCGPLHVVFAIIRMLLILMLLPLLLLQVRSL
jgi:hypothetical protein